MTHWNRKPSETDPVPAENTVVFDAPERAPAYAGHQAPPLPGLPERARRASRGDCGHRRTVGHLMKRLERVVLRWLQRRCQHPSSEVKADIGQADHRPLMVTWCATCGAVALNDQQAVDEGRWQEMRRPEPTWVQP